MISAAAIKSMVLPFQASTVAAFGSTVNIRCRHGTRAADNSTRLTWGNAQVAAGCHFFNYSKVQQVREWGREIEGELQGKFVFNANAKPGNGIIVTAGDHATQRFEIVDVEHFYLGQCSIVGLKLVTCEDFK